MRRWTAVTIAVLFVLLVAAAIWQYVLARRPGEYPGPGTSPLPTTTTLPAS